MQVFIAGIMQGSHLQAAMHGQDYREELKQLLAQHLPEAQVYDPLSDHRDSVSYGDDRGKTVFYSHNRMCREVDVVIAFIPEASMGTAIEMWEAFRCGRKVITISPLAHNWVVKYCSHAVYADLDQFSQALQTGEIASLLTCESESQHPEL